MFTFDGFAGTLVLLVTPCQALPTVPPPRAVTCLARGPGPVSYGMLPCPPWSHWGVACCTYTYTKCELHPDATHLMSVPTCPAVLHHVLPLIPVFYPLSWLPT